MPVTPHEDHIQYGCGEIPVDTAALRDIDDLFFIFFENGQCTVNIKFNPAGNCGKKAERRFQESGLAGSVRPEYGGQCPLRHLHVHVPKDGMHIVCHGHIFYFYCPFHGKAPYFNASTIVSIFALTMPIYVPAGLSGESRESE